MLRTDIEDRTEEQRKFKNVLRQVEITIFGGGEKKGENNVSDYVNENRKLKLTGKLFKQKLSKKRSRLKFRIQLMI